MSLNCFKAYDIRGRVPEELNDDIAYAIGRAFAKELEPGKVIVGRDIRLESPALANSLMTGLVDSGVDVTDIGVCGTEEVYFQTFHREGEGVGGGIMITASHNPKGYNGMKLVRAGARPISGDTGLQAVKEAAERLIAKGWNKESGADQAAGQTITDADKSAYIEHLLSYVDLSQLKPLKIVANPGNGGAGPVLRLLEEKLPFVFEFVQEEPDGNFPNGIPNPLLPENRAATADAVRRSGADMGVAWDGDFDRCFLFDENGEFIEGYYIVGLLSEAFLRKHPGEKIVHDPRLTWNTIDMVEQAGGVPIQSKTGHAFIKERMRIENAVYGGEMSAHHYFRDFAYCDSGMIPWLLVAELIGKVGQPLSALVQERVAAYPCSGEINYRVRDVSSTLERIYSHFAELEPEEDRTDGLSLEFAEWRMNLRGSNTEPLLRLNVEARGDAAEVKRRVAEIQSLIEVE
ncbi:phosphomannomutase [Guyparkeria sp. SB14A]|uniref:phosphomannomutase n=1 Tax=Guyparkeria sp. SB14A TaxID=2571147 RepID=UPI0010AC6941|nr:phosphomannomutase [Guyparkeria sp. SB14A]TKA89443.1 phosphomannomutase [Guyparkeria sp. SB14A]